MTDAEIAARTALEMCNRLKSNTLWAWVFLRHRSPPPVHWFLTH